MVYTDAATEPQNVGRFVLTNFINEAGLEALGGNLFRETPASGGPVQGAPGDEGFATVRQGYAETSNVNIASEITQLIAAQRANEMTPKGVEKADQLSATAPNTTRTTAHP